MNDEAKSKDALIQELQATRSRLEAAEEALAELVGKHISDALGTEAYETVRPHVAAALAGQAVSFESEVPYASGGARWVRAQYIPDHGADGSIQGYVSL